MHTTNSSLAFRFLRKPSGYEMAPYMGANDIPALGHWLIGDGRMTIEVPHGHLPEPPVEVDILVDSNSFPEGLGDQFRVGVIRHLPDSGDLLQWEKLFPTAEAAIALGEVLVALGEFSVNVLIAMGMKEMVL